ncbi:hypothetical protein N7495_004426 [Penicillium taxi]|uniref:uncharacterized protein n=1 Tax=Penicillium taxi TaxID=168475 RepID=UPI002545B8B4|nr:uncharacterized protein N7495_004426 [Penicillium taxi]KAJ5899682.1 hypothetical protein N7495_004426 [Penicillium taxi]
MSSHQPFSSDAPPSESQQNMLEDNVCDDWLQDEHALTFSALDDFYFCTSELPTPENPQGTGFDSQSFVPSEISTHSALHTAEFPIESVEINTGDTFPNVPHQSSPSIAKISQWLDGAYFPSVPCSHCRRYRLQCLVLRTTSANPNPVTSCASCVALFRECSLAKGEKRLPSGFETFTPVLGHLHGLLEHAEDSHEPMIPVQLEERKESTQFIRKGARILREWFHQNQEHPYPTEDQKFQLSEETGFSQKRISIWFANARRRQKQKLHMSNLPSRSRHRAGSPLVRSTLDTMSPIERWQVSPPDDEPVLESTIQDAIDTAMDLFPFDESTIDLFNFDETSPHLTSSVSSFGSQASETSDSICSAWSHQSGEMALPFPLSSETPRHRRQRKQKYSGEDNLYQCTFCTKSFRKRHDWSRHEKSVHLPFDTWICTPNPSELRESWGSHMADCSFCGISFPNSAHWDEHEFQFCSTKPLAERSFSRKDHLWQHLRKFHGCVQSPVADLDAWRGSGANIQSRCGFCDISLFTWTVRANHLSEHFKNGARMSQWVGDWGLDASAMNVLKCAILPFQRYLEASTQ